MAELRVLSVTCSSALPVVTKRIIERWGTELGDTREYTIGCQGDRAWIRCGRVDLSGNRALLAAIRDAISEVLGSDDP